MSFTYNLVDNLGLIFFSLYFRYTLRLTVNDGTKEGFGQISFEVYNTPTPGEFTVNPMTVEALNRISLTGYIPYLYKTYFALFNHKSIH